MNNLDRQLWNPRMIYSTITTKFVMENRYSANRFIFTENTTRRIAEILAECPTLILNSIQFARFPYEHTYIEYPGWVFSDNVNKNELW